MVAEWHKASIDPISTFLRCPMTNRCRVAKIWRTFLYFRMIDKPVEDPQLVELHCIILISFANSNKGCLSINGLDFIPPKSNREFSIRKRLSKEVIFFTILNPFVPFK